MFKPKPFWLEWFTHRDAWVSFSPIIYVPRHILKPSEFTPVILHEEAHLRQQEAIGRWRWLWKYMTSPSFMLRQEAEGVAAEVEASPAGRRHTIIESYALMFSVKDGMYETVFGRPCASSLEEARNAIFQALQELAG